MRRRSRSLPRPEQRASGSERGFALLLVMLMAAAVAFSLYVQLPRVGFESMREKEQLLMDRGNQYKRAIQVYYADNKRYPARLEDLENTNNKRYLRRRYKDPLTGKDEWRLIHTNGSYLTDSLVQKPPTQTAQNGTPGQGILPGSGPLGTNNMNSQPGQGSAPGQASAPGQGSGLGLFGNTPAANGAVNNNGTGTNIDPNTGLPIPAAVNPYAQRRPSDRLLPGEGTIAPAANPQQDNGTAPVYPPGYNPATFNPNDPSTWPPITIPTANTGQPGQTGQNGQTGPNGQPLQPGQLQPTGGQNTLAGQQQGTQITPLPFGQNQQQPAPGQSVPGQPVPGQVQPTPLPFGAQQSANNNDGTSGQTTPSPVGSGTLGQSPGVGGANPQPVNNGLGFNNPFAPDTSQEPAGSPSTNPFANQQSGIQPGAQGSQQSPAALNPALQAINSQLSNPTGAAGGNPNTQTAPGIAGVASTYEGVGIKIYNKRSKYKEWEFVYDPSTSTPTGSTTPGQNPSGQPAQSSGTPSGASPFGQTPNPFSPSTGQSPNSSQTPGSSAPATNPFAPSSSPFGTGQ